MFPGRDRRRGRAGLAPARIGWARGTCAMAHNRVLALAGQPDADIDDEVVVGRIQTAGGRPLATLVHYTCHPTAAGSGNRLATADWCGVTRQRLEDAGCGPTMIVNGAGGDINVRMDGRGFHSVDRGGNALADAALPLWESATPRAAHGVGYRRAVDPVALRPLGGPDEIAALQARWRERETEHPPGSMRHREGLVSFRDLQRRLARHHWGSEPPVAYAGETQALRIGPLAIVALPGEFFIDHGRQVKRDAPAPAAMVAGWSNDNLGYFPTAAGFAIGGYEMEIAYRYYGYPASWTAESGQAIATRARSLLEQLFPRPQ